MTENWRVSSYFDRGRSVGACGYTAPALRCPSKGATRMGEVAQLAEVASLVGDPTRANILSALMDGRAHTASELAYLAHVTAPTASGHLARLREARLIQLARQGRHHYYRLATPE